MLKDKPEIETWFRSQVDASMRDDDVIEAYNKQHPSKVFLRNLPLNATVVDVGAGDGGLSVFKRWPSPARPDLKLFAFSLEKGSLFDQFEAYELGNWNEMKPSFGGRKFDAIYCANFIEHVDDPSSLIRWANCRLAAGGRLYIEWPSDRSLFCPTLPELADMGFGCIIGNYYDDPTHRRRMPSYRYVERHLRRSGFSIESRGTITMPLIADELLAYYKRTADIVTLQQAYWLKTGWIQYVVATRSGPRFDWSKLIRRAKAIIKRPPDYAEFADKMRAGS